MKTKYPSKIFLNVAKDELGWVATKTLEDMCKDSWNYIEKSM